MTILDRYLFRDLTVNYLIALAVMMSLYVVLDLFFNMDEFTEQGGAVSGVLVDGFSYYWPNLFRYFGQLSGVITLAACLATLARMRRANELTAVLASGVSLFRVAAPVMGFGLVTTILWVVDTELLVPRVAAQLARSHDDARGERTYGVWFLEDGPNALLSAQQFEPGTGTLRRMLVLKLDDSGTVRSGGGAGPDQRSGCPLRPGRDHADKAGALLRERARPPEHPAAAVRPVGQPAEQPATERLGRAGAA